MKLIFLGTSAMLPTENRNTSSILIRYNNEGILIDCGEGTQRQLRLAKISPTKITKLLISHWHGDHILGIPGLIQSLGANNYNKTLEIYGPKGTKHYLSNLLGGMVFRNKISFNVKEINQGVIFKNKDFSLQAFKLKHSVPCLAYSFIEADTRNINLDYTKKFGLKQHPLLGKLQKGHDIKYNGKVIRADKATKIKKGKKVTVIVDTYYFSGLKKFAKDADLLICESTWLEGQKTKRGEHMTNIEAAKLAKSAKVKKLILTHFSQRYKTLNEIKKGAKKIFKNTDYAKDLMKIKV